MKQNGIKKRPCIRNMFQHIKKNDYIIGSIEPIMPFMNVIEKGLALNMGIQFKRIFVDIATINDPTCFLFQLPSHQPVSAANLQYFGMWFILQFWRGKA